MRRLLFTFLLFACVLSLPAVAEEGPLFPVKVKGKWGFINREGEIVIEPRFQQVDSFSEGLADARMDYKWGWIDESGEWAIEPQWEMTGSFDGGMARIMDGGRFGFIRPDGSWAIELQEGWALDFNDGLCAARVGGGYGFLNREGEWAVEPKYDYYHEFSEGLGFLLENLSASGGPAWICFDTQGNEVWRTDRRISGSFSEGLAPFNENYYLGSERGGWLDRDGNTAFQPLINHRAFNFSGGIGQMQKEYLPEAEPSYLLVDRNGERIGERMYYDARDFKYGRCVVQEKQNLGWAGWGMIDESGEYVLEPEYAAIGDMSEEGVALVYGTDGFRLVDRDGEEICRLSEEIHLMPQKIYPFENGLAKINFRSYPALLDADLNLREMPQLYWGSTYGKSVSEGLSTFNLMSYTEIVDLEGLTLAEIESAMQGEFSEGLCAASDGEVSAWGFVNSKGDWVFEPRFTTAAGFHEGLATVSTERKWGFVNPKGEWAIAPEFEMTQPFNEGLACARKGGRWGFIDKAGEWAIPAEYEDALPFNQGLAPVKTDAGWGFVSPKGIMLIAPGYEDARPFNEGLAPVMVDGLYGYVNRLGRMVIEPQFFTVERFSEGRAAVSRIPERKLDWDPMTVDRDRYESVCDWSVIDKTGETVVELGPKMPNAPFSSGLMPVRTEWLEFEYINLDGEFVTDLAVHLAGGFSEGYAWVNIPYKVAYVDLEGNVVWGPTY